MVLSPFKTWENVLGLPIEKSPHLSCSVGPCGLLEGRSGVSNLLIVLLAWHRDPFVQKVLEAGSTGCCVGWGALVDVGNLSAPGRPFIPYMSSFCGSPTVS